MRSRHLDLLKNLSDKNRAREEQQRREETRIQKRASLLRDRVLLRSCSAEPGGAGASGAAAAPLVRAADASTVAVVATAAIAAAAVDAVGQDATAGEAGAAQLSVEEQERRLNRKRCNAAVEKRSEEALRRLVSQQEAEKVKEERKKLKVQWRAHRAKEYLLASCRNSDIRDYLESKGKPRALPKLPPGSGESFLPSAVLSIRGFSAEPLAEEAEDEETDLLVEEETADAEAAQPSSSSSGPKTDKYERNCSSPVSFLPAGADQQTHVSVQRFLERNRKTRAQAHCGGGIDDWKRRNGCCPERQVFICLGGYPDFQEALLKRGWFQNMDGESRHFDLKWGMKKDIDNDRLRPNQLVNHFANCGDLVTKVGLSVVLRNCAWHCGVGSDEFYPRAFDLADVNERADFVTDFKFTKAESILRQFVEHMHQGVEMTFSQDVVNIASKICLRLVTDVDDVLDCPEMAESLAIVEASEWDVLKQVCLEDVARKLEQVLKDEELQEMIARPAPPATETKKKPSLSESREQADPRKGSKAKDKTKKKKAENVEVELSAPVASFDNPRGQHLFQQAQSTIQELESKNAQHTMHGTRNAWIVKPGAKSRGRGIQVMRELDEIFDAAQADGFQWICQKYIEQPQLIHGYKFDIRQWVLVTDWNPLTVYMWQQPYIRFAGQKYDSSLSSLSEYMHLSNNSILKYMDGFEETNADLNVTGFMWFKQQYEEWLHTTHCKCKRHSTPWMMSPPYTCETFGVKWEDVAFTAKDEDDEDEDGGDPTGTAANATASSSESATIATPAVATDVASSEETRSSTPRDSEVPPAPQSPGNEEAVVATEAEAPCSLECPCGRSFRPKAEFCQKCGISPEKAEASTAEKTKSEETQSEEAKAEATNEEADGEDSQEHECDNLWESCIKTQIADIVSWSLQSVVDSVAHRKNSFELYGYDFMLSPGVDGKPKVWLIEVNSSPACDYSTPVTTPLVKKLMEDTAKVMVDKRADPDCDIGEWELLDVACSKFVKPQRYLGNEKLEVVGTQIKPPKNTGKKGKKKKGKSSKSKASSSNGDPDDEDADDGEDDEDAES